MLARIQRTLCVALLLSVLLASLALGWRGAPLPDHAFYPLLLIALYASALAAEFALMHRVNRQDNAPRASLRQLLAALWHELTTAPRVFCWRQPFRAAIFPDQIRPATADRAPPAAASVPAQALPRGVLLVHGYVCNRGLWLPWLAALRRHGVACIALNLEPVFGGIEQYEGLIDEAVQRLQDSTGLAPVVVAHSMGGLAVRFWWARPDRASRLHRLITLGTPHHGTWLARFAMSRNATQMRPGSHWLQQLNEQHDAARAARTVCFYSHCDNIVFPASSATLPGADNRHLPATAHVHMVEHAEPRRALWQSLGLSAPGQ